MRNNFFKTNPQSKKCVTLIRMKYLDAEIKIMRLVLEFSRYDFPDCETRWYFESIKEIEEFILKWYPVPPIPQWYGSDEFYPNGLRIYEIEEYKDVIPLRGEHDSKIIRIRDPDPKKVIRMHSMVDVYDFEYGMPLYTSPEYANVAKLIYDLQIIVDQIEEGVYEFPK